MKIDGSKAQQAFEAYRNAPDAARTNGPEPQPATATTKAQAPDRAEISEHGRQFARALDAVRQSPETRADLVSSLKKQVQDGTYTVDGKRLAETLARHIDVNA